MRRRHRFRLAHAAAFASALVFVPSGTSAPETSLAAAFPGGSYFAIGCGFSHRSNDDPIVFPRQPGRSHNHTFVGNRTVNAFSTPDLLVGGPTTCELDADASTYWVPTLFDRREPVNPLVGIVYYVKRTSGSVALIPAGLKIVAGNADARRPQPKGVVAWACGAVGMGPRFAVVPACSEDELLQLQVTFPSCWNGRELDSPNHRRHMAYAASGLCPRSHPVALPTIALILLYPPQPARARVASGRFGAHADFVNGWDQDVLSAFVRSLNY